MFCLQTIKWMPSCLTHWHSLESQQRQNSDTKNSSATDAVLLLNLMQSMALLVNNDYDSILDKILLQHYKQSFLSLNDLCSVCYGFCCCCDSRLWEWVGQQVSCLIVCKQNTVECICSLWPLKMLRLSFVDTGLT